jgi:hypothetical protein
MTFLYPYPHQIFAMAITAIILYILGIPVYVFFIWLRRVHMSAVIDLYASLINNQGREVEFEVKRNGEIMTITLVVPEMDIWDLRHLPYARF